MKRIIFLIFILFSACVSKNPKVSILNKSMIAFDSIKVYSTFSSPTVFVNVKKGENLKGKIYLDETILSDGAYRIEIFKNGDVMRDRNFGYFTNGSSLNNSFKIIIETDTIKIKSR